MPGPIAVPANATNAPTIQSGALEYLWRFWGTARRVGRGVAVPLSPLHRSLHPLHGGEEDAHSVRGTCAAYGVHRLCSKEMQPKRTSRRVFEQTIPNNVIIFNVIW